MRDAGYVLNRSSRRRRRPSSRCSRCSRRRRGTQTGAAHWADPERSFEVHGEDLPPEALRNVMLGDRETWAGLMPALFTSTSIRPNRSRTASTKRRVSRPLVADVQTTTAQGYAAAVAAAISGGHLVAELLLAAADDDGRTRLREALSGDPARSIPWSIR